MRYNEVMAITPDTDLYLLKCPIESDQRNQLTFSTRSAQETYFKSLPKISLDNFSYQRKDGYIRVSQHIDSIIGYNYVMYRNNNYTNRWFYAFVTNMEYVNDKCTFVYIKTDVYQTWCMDINVKASYVEREHVNDDTVGAHTVPEGLETGEYICNAINEFIYGDPESIDGFAAMADFYVAIQVTTLKFKDGLYLSPPSGYYNTFNSVPQGCFIIGIELSKATLAGLSYLTGLYDGNGKGDAIQAMFILPKSICAGWTEYTQTGDALTQSGWHYYCPLSTKNPTNITGTTSTSGGTTITELMVPINSTVDGYTPKNNKLLTREFNYFTVSNNNGTDIPYYYEDFRPIEGNTAGTPEFVVIGSFEQGGNIMCYPVNSKRTTNSSGNGFDSGWIEGVPGAQCPMLSWISDYYLNWQAQNGKLNKIQENLATAHMGVNAVKSIVTFDPNGLTELEGGANQIWNIQQQRRVAQMTPPQAKGTASVGTLAYSGGWASKFTARKMSVRQEYARQIDGFFSMFGYKVCMTKVPNFTGRLNWNYVKTAGFNCEGDVPEQDLQEYKSIFNKGVTLWHNPSTFMDYTQNNNII